MTGAPCVVIGAAGGLGAALAERLEQDGRCVLRLSRRSAPPLDLLDEPSIAAAAEAAGAGLQLVIDATGFLHGHGFQPEKSLRQLDAAHLAHSFAVNATGPAMLMKHFLPRLDRDRRAVFATLSARVGSISDNRSGGWFAYRASKAALNQLIRTAAVELARTRPRAICVALHPGTVHTDLSRPFSTAGLDPLDPQAAATRLLAAIDTLTPSQSGLLLDYEARPIAF